MDQLSTKIQNSDKGLAVAANTGTMFWFTVTCIDSMGDRGTFCFKSHLIDGSPPFRCENLTLVLKAVITKDLDGIRSNNVKDCIVICQSLSMFRMEEIRSLMTYAASNGALAVVCDIDPKFGKYSLPIFCIDALDSTKFTLITKNARVIITPMYKHCIPIEADTLTKDTTEAVQETEGETLSRGGEVKEERERNFIAKERDFVARERDFVARERDFMARERDCMARERDFMARETEFLARERDSMASDRGFIERERAFTER